MGRVLEHARFGITAGIVAALFSASSVGAADNPTLGTLSSVAAMPNGALAVGGTRERLCQHGLAESGGAGAWAAMHVPAPPGCSSLDAVAADGHGGAWAVGEFLASGGVRHTLIERFDGHAWSIVTSPSPGRQAALGGVTVLPNGTAVAVGAYEDTSRAALIGVTKTLIVQNDGGTWHVVPSPSIGPNSALNAVAARPNGRMWAVGHYSDPSTIQHKTLVLTFDPASGWQTVPSPSPETNIMAGTDLVAVAARGSVVWAVGHYVDTSKHPRTLTMRSDGHTWSIVPTPFASSTIGTGLEGVVIAPDGTPWAAGSYADSACQHTLVMRYAGNEWEPVASPSPTCTPNRGSALHGFAVDAHGTLYAVGDTNNVSTLVLVNHGNGWQVERS
jgi:hypothetical protein